MATPTTTAAAPTDGRATLTAVVLQTDDDKQVTKTIKTAMADAAEYVKRIEAIGRIFTHSLGAYKIINKIADQTGCAPFNPFLEYSDSDGDTDDDGSEKKNKVNKKDSEKVEVRTTRSIIYDIGHGAVLLISEITRIVDECHDIVDDVNYMFNIAAVVEAAQRTMDRIGSLVQDFVESTKPASSSSAATTTQ